MTGRHPLQNASRNPKVSGIDFILLAACCASLSACSRYYSLGDVPLDSGAAGNTSFPNQAVTAPQLVGAAVGEADRRVSAVLSDADSTLLLPDGVLSRSVSAVGDLDGDGYADLVLTTVDFPGGASHAFLRYGGPRTAQPSDAPEFTEGAADLRLDVPYYNSLSAVAVGDVDGDGYGDLLINSSECTPSQPGNGAYLLYGGPERLTGSVDLQAVASHFVPSPRASSPLGAGSGGCGVDLGAGPGDLDGDGYDDLVITTPSPANIAPDEPGASLLDHDAAVYVFYGGPQRLARTVSYAAADASFHIDTSINTYAAGDVNGDGRPDLLVAPGANWPPIDPGSYLIFGSGQRYSGRLDLRNARQLTGAYVGRGGYRAGDINGDGVSDLILMDAQRSLHLFYGAPHLFATGFDFSGAAAELGDANDESIIFPIGDRDGDGDDELLDLFYLKSGSVPNYYAQDVSLLSGTRQRLAGAISFEEGEVSGQHPNGRFSDPARLLTDAFPAGDLDGDGRADLFTTSSEFTFLSPDPLSHNYTTEAPELHIHYGGARSPASEIR